ncbi:hypothetical protein CF327_g3715 [Tilletia walkeri]|nr:hypothetical protein CF327_g3715 [Tilletia walkeri]
MSPVEQRVYDFWREGANIPVLHPEENRKPEKAGGQTSDTRRDRLEALHRIYGKKPGTYDDSNVRFFEAEYQPLLNLLTAVVKLIRAERSVTGGSAISPEKFAEYQAVKRLRGMYTALESDIFRDHRLLTQQNTVLNKDLDKVMNELGGDFEKNGLTASSPNGHSKHGLGNSHPSSPSRF